MHGARLACFWGTAMEVIKSLILGAILSVMIALVIGAQGTSGGALAIHLVHIADAKLYWSWPVFFSGSGLAFGLLLLQR
jgi:acetyl-CoA carboxylase alpha subunit